jgi:hypothetical protein
VELSAPPLVPIVALALATGGQAGEVAAGPERAQPARPGLHAGATVQGRPVAIRVRAGGRSASWRIGYVARCEDGTTIRGRYVSGDGTPPLPLGPDGRFRLSRTEPAEFRPEGTGSARFEISGQLGPAGGSGSWSLRLVTPPLPGGSVECTTGSVGWRTGAPSA